MKRKRLSNLADRFIPSGVITINKRQRFVLSVALCALGLFMSENLLGRSGFYVTFFLSLLSGFLFFLSVFGDIRGKYSLYIFILPVFLYTLSVGLFYFLVPQRFLSRFIVTGIYAFGLYSLYLSQNINIVASIRTIPLLAGARIVSFVITFLSYFCLSAVIYTLNSTLILPLYITGFLVFIVSFLAVFQSIAVTYEKSFKQSLIWSLPLALCMLEMGLVLWFWPTTPVFIAIFMTGFFYTVVGVSHAWLEKRLFRGVIWEYIWIPVIIFAIFIVLTSWRG